MHITFLKVDHSRVNEFGFSGDMLEEAEKKRLDGNANGDVSQETLPAIEQRPLRDDNTRRPKSAKAKKTD